MRRHPKTTFIIILAMGAFSSALLGAIAPEQRAGDDDDEGGPGRARRASRQDHGLQRLPHPVEDGRPRVRSPT